MSITSTQARTVSEIRARFPALQTDFVFFENAGGSQVPAEVANAIRDYMLTSYVQLGGGFELSKRADKVVADAHAFINIMMNGENRGKVILGPSSTQLCTMLAECYSRLLSPGDRVVVCQTGHEANVGPWMKLERFGIGSEIWKIDPASFECPLSSLEAILKAGKVKVVAFPHVSNLLGEVVDVPAITSLAHRYGARVVVDGVAYAPHRPIDVEAWDVDWYVYSTYKVYGPHMSALYGRQDAIEELTGPNHFFLPKDLVPYKFELGGASHEGCAGLLALKSYLNFIAGENGEASRRAVERAFNRMGELELPLQAELIDYLRNKAGVSIIGPATAGIERIPTISFLVEGKRSKDVCEAVDSTGRFGIKRGHMYAYRMCEALGIDTDDGVVRVSMVHYNTHEEVAEFIRALDRLI